MGYYRIDDKWELKQLPIINGIIHSDNRVQLFEMNENSGKRNVSFYKTCNINELNLDLELEVSKVIINDEIMSEDGKLKVMCGEGSFGGDGFIVLYSLIEERVIWILFSEVANPFIKVELLDNEVVALNNLDENWIISLANEKEVKIQ